MSSKGDTYRGSEPGLEQEVRRLRDENARLQQDNASAYAYIRNKVDQMLKVIGTKTLRPEELDDASLVEFDPIGIVADSFQHVLNNLRETYQKLHFAHNEIQAIFDTVGAALLVLNPQQQIIAYNQKTKALLLGEDRDVLGHSCRDAICSGAPPSGCLFAKVMQTGREQQAQDWSANGHHFYVVGRPLFDETGQVSHVVMAYSDVTDRKAAEEALLQSLAETQEANSKIQGILKSVSDCLLVTDAEDRIVLINHRAEELLGFYLANPAQRPGVEMLSCEPLKNLLIKGKNSDGFLADDISFTDQQDQEIIYQARVTVIRSAEGAYRGCIAFLHDVTEQRELDRLKSDFVSTAAHELRTPLATIIGYADLLLNADAGSHETLNDYLHQIQQKAERLADIVSDLLDISRIESGEALKVAPQPCRIDTLCNDFLASYQVPGRRHSLEFLSPDGPPVVVNADRYAFDQILENVVNNAVKYSPSGGKVVLSVQADNAHCRLSVADNGIGMKPEQVERIFDKFYRADATNTAISGTGLGMTIVKYLVEAQHGSVRVESEPNTGTIVHISLPLAGTVT